jgi:hypothetical protein
MLTSSSRAACAAQDRAQARGDLARIARLGYVVVGAQFQAEDAVEVFAQRGEHEHRQGVFAAQLAQQVQSRAAGQHHVQDQCVVAAIARARERLVAVVADIHGESVAREEIAQELAQLLVVVGQQDLRLAHAREVYLSRAVQARLLPEFTCRFLRRDARPIACSSAAARRWR